MDAVTRLLPCAALVLALLSTIPAGAAGAAGGAARAEHTLSSGGTPLTVTADTMAYANREGRLVFSGGVQVVRDEYRMESDRLQIDLAELESERRDIRHMVAEGNVVFIYGERTAHAGRAEYDPKAGTVVLTEEPKLSDPRMEVVGEVITIDLATQESTVQGGSFTFTENPEAAETATDAAPASTTPPEGPS